MPPRTDTRKFAKISRRELLKLTPVLALGAFAIPKLKEPLLKAGLGFSELFTTSRAPLRSCAVEIDALIPHLPHPGGHIDPYR